jgi:histidyl-tRNA synthetase
VPLDSLRSDFNNLGVHDEMLSTMVEVLKINTLDSLRSKLNLTQPIQGFGDGGGDGGGNDDEQLQRMKLLESEFAQLELLFSYAEKAGIADWLVLETSMVRGLSYYTGIVFEVYSCIHIHIHILCVYSLVSLVEGATEFVFKMSVHMQLKLMENQSQ